MNEFGILNVYVTLECHQHYVVLHPKHRIELYSTLVYSIQFHCIIRIVRKKAIYCNGFHTRHGPKDTCAITWKMCVIIRSPCMACKKEAPGLFCRQKSQQNRIRFLVTDIRKHMFGTHCIYFIHLFTAKLTYVTCIVLGYVFYLKADILRIHIMYSMFSYKKLAFVVCVYCVHIFHLYPMIFFCVSFSFSHSTLTFERTNNEKIHNFIYHQTKPHCFHCHQMSKRATKQAMVCMNKPTNVCMRHTFSLVESFQ